MQQSKPEVTDRVDFEEQLEALVNASEECDEIHQSDISAVLFRKANNSSGKEW